MEEVLGKNGHINQKSKAGRLMEDALPVAVIDAEHAFRLITNASVNVLGLQESLEYVACDAGAEAFQVVL